MKIKEMLESKLRDFDKNSIPKRKNRIRNIFKKRFYISPGQIYIKNYIRKTPIAAFNPGAILIGKKVYIFPRMVFDYYTYNSSIGVFSVNIDELMDGVIPERLETEIILWPDKIWEFGHGVEDPRVYKQGDIIYMLYTGSKHYERDGKLHKKSVLALSEVRGRHKGFSASKRGYFKIVNGHQEYVPGCKDSAFIEPYNGNITMLLRFDTDAPASCWRGVGNINNLTIDIDSIEPVFIPSEWEEKVGWSTNVVKLTENKYLVGWHAVLKEDLAYKNGFALVDNRGKLLGITDYLLSPEGLIESYGDRGLVIFGDGLLRYEDQIIWVGGVSDYAIGIFVTSLSDILDQIL